MNEQRDVSEEGGGDRFAYFMVRIHGGAGEGRVKPSGIVERLGSARKDTFSGAEELIRLLTELPDVAPNMRRDTAAGNAGNSENVGNE
jgi:hypothetical protein